METSDAIDELWARAQVTRDSTGTPIDAGIVETVVALWAHGIETTFSCEGHVDSEPFPWVTCEAAFEGDNPTDPVTLLGRRTRLNLEHEARLLALLEEFYSGRRSPLHVMLHLGSKLEAYGFTLCCQGSDTNRLRTEAERESFLRLYQAEMAAFTHFLLARLRPELSGWRRSGAGLFDAVEARARPGGPGAA